MCAVWAPINSLKFSHIPFQANPNKSVKFVYLFPWSTRTPRCLPQGKPCLGLYEAN